ncbi:hypothetical protein BCR35DRAFT_222354 [Leucosporidium creatinivorum]|uniref:Uncharacterized protein n=1 Tax=Leucosporidium creatinivorum TaxID=106004 RepID=A0A1Y2D788_9BASI|nr:hypothetical protein BCR35DRAFT_222354 [Leucosporidium creatinivorum]
MFSGSPARGQREGGGTQRRGGVGDNEARLPTLVSRQRSTASPSPTNLFSSRTVSLADPYDSDEEHQASKGQPSRPSTSNARPTAAHARSRSTSSYGAPLVGGAGPQQPSAITSQRSASLGLGSPSSSSQYPLAPRRPSLSSPRPSSSYHSSRPSSSASFHQPLSFSSAFPSPGSTPRPSASAYHASSSSSSSSGYSTAASSPYLSPRPIPSSLGRGHPAIQEQPSFGGFGGAGAGGMGAGPLPPRAGAGIVRGHLRSASMGGSIGSRGGGAPGEGRGGERAVGGGQGRPPMGYSENRRGSGW